MPKNHILRRTFRTGKNQDPRDYFDAVLKISSRLWEINVTNQIIHTSWGSYFCANTIIGELKIPTDSKLLSWKIDEYQSLLAGPMGISLKCRN
jgi:hypothetical protein